MINATTGQSPTNRLLSQDETVTMPGATRLPYLWEGDEIEAREDGFLWLNDHEDEQPLILRSTELLLQTLYPDTPRESIFTSVGFMEEVPIESTVDSTTDVNEASSNENPGEENDQGHPKDFDEASLDADVEPVNEDPHPQPTQNPSSTAKGEKKKKKILKVLPKYKMYQTLIRDNTIAARSQSALLDIRYNRHRKRRPDGGRADWSKDGARIRALEHQQERLVSSREAKITANVDDSNTGVINVESNDDNEDNDDELPSNLETEDEEAFERETSHVRLVRTINSIRALFPHLLPILLHPLRNDRELVIGKARWKRRSRGQMCWLLGTKVFDATSTKVATALLDSMKGILHGFLDTDLALRISADPQGTPAFWTSSWISQVLQKGSRPVANPLSILADYTKDLDAVKAICRDCDQKFLSRKPVSPGIQNRYQDAITRVHQRIEKLLKHRFPGARLSIYGSCLSELSLGHASDIDLSLWLPEMAKLKQSFKDGLIEAAKYEKETKNVVYQACRKLENYQHEFRNMQPIARARVPVLKGTYLKAGNPHSQDGNINFDICFLNDIAVANSSLIREYSLVDCRGKELMLAVKRWAKEFNINSAKDNTISSYTWINMVIFYLQCLRFFPNLQDPNLMALAGLIPDPEGNIWHNVNDLDTCFLTWSQVRNAHVWGRPAELEDISVSELLYGFFEFYCRRFPSAIYAVSIKRGSICLPRMECRKNSLFICIEDPFETFDSYCPHDLGSHATECGVKDILQYLNDAEKHLRKMLLGAPNKCGLWPEPPFLDPQPPRNNKNAQFRRFEKTANGKGAVQHSEDVKKDGDATRNDEDKIEKNVSDPTKRRINTAKNQGRRTGQGRGNQGQKRGQNHQGRSNDSETGNGRSSGRGKSGRSAGPRNGEKTGSPQGPSKDEQNPASRQQHGGRSAGTRSNRRRKPHPGRGAVIHTNTN